MQTFMGRIYIYVYVCMYVSKYFFSLHKRLIINRLCYEKKKSPIMVAITIIISLTFYIKW